MKNIGINKKNKNQQSSNTTSLNERIESDSIGSKALPAEALYGIQTARASDNFQLSKKRLGDFSHFVAAIAMVKKSCAIANQEVSNLDKKLCELIVEASQQLIDGENHDAFIVDMIQGGAGTSSNMNANEVIANMVALSLNKRCGDYSSCHPNNHVNLSQSTNDVYPTAIRVAILLGWTDFEIELNSLIAAFRKRGEEFSDIVKLGRTQLQDGVPMTIGQEFNAFANLLENEQSALLYARNSLYAVNLGGTAIGTGINAKATFGTKAIKVLAEECRYPLFQASDLMTASYDVGPLMNVSAAFKNLALKLSKIANDLRLLSMGPRGGLNEINLPPMQPGSSIMPGKVNPVIPEAVSQVAYQVIGFDQANSFAAESGQLQLNAMEPLIAYNLMESASLLCATMSMFNHRCIQRLSVNRVRCQELLENSMALATALTPFIGYDNASRLAKKALTSDSKISDLVVDERLIDRGIIDDLITQFKLPGN